MTTQVIAVGTTETAFSAGEFTVAAGTQVTLMIKGSTSDGIPVGAKFELARKTTGGQYTTLPILLDHSNILEKGCVRGGAEDVVYAIRRRASPVSAGIDKA